MRWCENFHFPTQHIKYVFNQILSPEPSISSAVNEASFRMQHVQHVRDDDFKLILAVGKKTLQKNIKILEQEMIRYGIPLPVRPPKQTHTTAKLEEVSDRHIFRRILRGIQSFLPIHTTAFVHSTSPKDYSHQFLFTNTRVFHLHYHISCYQSIA